MLGKKWAGKNNTKKWEKKLNICLNLFFTLNTLMVVFMRVYKWHICWNSNIVLLIFSSYTFLWRTRSKSTTEIPGQQLDQYKTVSFLEYVTKTFSFFSLICYSTWPNNLWKKMWNFSHCQSPYMYMYITLKVLLNAS